MKLHFSRIALLTLGVSSAVLAADHPVFGRVNDTPEVVALEEAAQKLIIGPDGKATAINAAAEQALVAWWHAWTAPKREGSFGEAAMWDGFQALTKDPAIATPMAVYTDPKDDTRMAWKILVALKKESPDLFQKHPLVAVAFALTHDDTGNFLNHTPQAPKERRLVGKESVPERFREYLGAAAAGKLLFNPAQLTFTKLKFVVGHDLPFSEIEWARKNVVVQPANLGKKTFYSINYDHPRLKNDQLRWPHSDDYSLAAIKSKGGVCADQAYFGVMVGKAWGVPTMYFSGQGQRGRHAWLGYMRTAKLWDFEEGRYAYDNYSVGNTRDPQTGEPISDAYLDYFAADVETNKEFPQSALLLKWVKAKPERAGNAELLRTTIRWMPQFFPAWETLGTVMKNQPRSEQHVFWKSWISQFQNSPEILYQGLRAHLVFCEEDKRDGDAALLRRRMLEDTMQGRTDLRIRMARFITERWIAVDKFDEASDVATTALARLAEKNKGLFGAGYVTPVCLGLAKKGQKTLAEDIVKRAVKRIGETDEIKDLRSELKKI